MRREETNFFYVFGMRWRKRRGFSGSGVHNMRNTHVLFAMHTFFGSVWNVGNLLEDFLGVLGIWILGERDGWMRGMK